MLIKKKNNKLRRTELKRANSAYQNCWAIALMNDDKYLHYWHMQNLFTKLCRISENYIVPWMKIKNRPNRYYYTTKFIL